VTQTQTQVSGSIVPQWGPARATETLPCCLV